MAPFSSNKIRAKILDLGYGGARSDFIAAKGGQIVTPTMWVITLNSTLKQNTWSQVVTPGRMYI